MHILTSSVQNRNQLGGKLIYSTPRYEIEQFFTRVCSSQINLIGKYGKKTNQSISIYILKEDLKDIFCFIFLKASFG